MLGWEAEGLAVLDQSSGQVIEFQGPQFPQLYHMVFELKIVPHVPSSFSL